MTDLVQPLTEEVAQSWNSEWLSDLTRRWIYG